MFNTTDRSAARRVISAMGWAALFLVAGQELAGAAEGDDPLVDDAIQSRWAATDITLFDDATSSWLAVVEQREKTRRRTEEGRYKTIRMTHEIHACSRLATDSLDDTETSRRRDKLKDACETAARYTQAGRPPVDLAVTGVRDLALAPAYAHSEGIVHRDVKPGNVMLDAHDRPQSMDSGLARRLDADSSLTAEGALLGTPAYMSPE
jgi:hypothetical protein